MADKVARVRELLSRGNLWLAPMAGVTDAVFRSICVSHGCGMCVTEMVSATGMAYGSKKTRQLYLPGPGEDLVGVQLFGACADEMARAGAQVEEDLGGRLAFIDVNMGCPVPKVTKRGAGSALMRDPARAAAIVRAVDAAVSVPVTAKFRRGWNLEEADPVGFARVLEEAGAAALTVHGRTTGQLYRGEADWGCVGDVARAVSVPVLGNGDLSSAQVCAQRLAEHPVEGLAIARGAQGNPWIFSQLKDLLAGREPHVPTAVERVEALRGHARLMAEHSGEDRWLSPMRKHAIWYLAGVPYSSRLRGSVDSCTTLEDFEAFCDRALELVRKAQRDNEAHEAARREQP